MKRVLNIIFVIFLCSTLILVFFGGEKIHLLSVEDLGISVGIGVGIDKEVEGDISYRITSTANTYRLDSSVETLIGTGVGSTIGKTRENRQKKIGKEFFLGLTKICLVEEEYAKYGIRALMDVNFKNPKINDNAFLVICKGRNEEYFNYTIPGYDNSAEGIADMVENSVNYNFFQKGYMLKDAILSMDAEGKNIVSPYIEIMEDGIKISGLTVFSKDKLAAILDMKDTRIMNMLRENNVKGILTIQKDSEKYVNFQVESKRKITCRKIGDKYTFNINLNLKGEIINNELYKDMASDIEGTKKFEDDMARQVSGMCTEFLEKMKNKYKLDLLQLGWVAAAKYGRDTGVDWNEVVSNSKININVKVSIDKLGRGQY
ncbi:Ger(x)C family spore germination protein [Clostridium sp.]|uniref:Ger(x)C family spore germination protein n=1 Tax=Clostridium sp. TaxID=1506 RepID=UPI003D6CD713